MNIAPFANPMQTDPLKLLEEYVRFPSVSTDPAYHEGMEGARAYASDALKALGFDVEVVTTTLHPILLAERKGRPGAPHLLFYAHYDVQPADPFERWESPPFEPTIRNGRLYARGAADNKGPLCVQLAALARLFKEQPDCPLNLTFLIEGEEETGSPSFPVFLEHYAERLKQADLLIFSDTATPRTDQMVITTGLRGLCSLEIEVNGPANDLHSGIHGGAIRNPIDALAELLSHLHDQHGTVTIPGFYDDVAEIEKWERDELEKLPFDEAAYQSFLDVPAFHPPKGYTALEAVRFGPTLEFNGIGGGYQGIGTKTVIPSHAFAKLTCRLVPNQRPERILELVCRYIEQHVPKGVRVTVRGRADGAPYRVVPPNRPDTPRDQSLVMRQTFEIAEAAIEGVFGKSPLYLREGGSVPIISQIKERTGLDALMLGIFSPEDNLHAPNESFELAFMEKATQVYTRLLSDLATANPGR